MMGRISETVKAGGGEIIGIIPNALLAREGGREPAELRIVRSMHHPMRNHNSAAAEALTGRTPVSGDLELLGDEARSYPTLGSSVSYALGSRSRIAGRISRRIGDDRRSGREDKVVWNTRPFNVYRSRAIILGGCHAQLVIKRCRA